MASLRFPPASHPFACCVLTLAFAGGMTGAAGQTAQQARPDAPAEASQNARFDILEYEIEGNTRLANRDIERAVMPHLGPNRTIDDVELARAALEKAYQTRGFLTVTVIIPEQQVADGIVRLAVTEGRVERLRVTGSRYYSLGEIRARVPALAEGSVPDFTRVQTELASLNRSDDRRVQPVLRAGRTPGTVEVDLQVRDRLPLHGDLELNNRASASTRPLRLNASVRYDNLWQRDHGIGMSFQTTPQDPDQVRVYAGTYVVPGINGDDVLALYAVRSDSDVAAIGTLNVLGKGNIVGMRYIMPQKPVERFAASATLGVDYKDFKDRINVSDTQSFTTPISYAVLVASATGTWRGTPTSGAQTDVTQTGITLTFGPRGLLGTKDGEFERKRAFASSSFLAARMDVSRVQPLGERTSMFARAEAQLASGALVSNEQYFLGGGDTVRGYREAEALGDDGLRGTFELRYALASGGSNAAAAVPADAVVFLFADAGTLRVREPLPEQRTSFQLASTGLGFRLKAARGWRLSGDLARVLRDGPQLRDGPITRAGDTRVLFRLGYEF